MNRTPARLPAALGCLLVSLGCTLLLVSLTGNAAAGDGDGNSTAAFSAPASSNAPVSSARAAATANSASAAPVGAALSRVVAGVYRGTLGGDSIEMTLTQDKDAEDSVHGFYVVLGRAKQERVQLAGEWEDDTLSLEESHNGVDVSGNWNAIFNADGFAGQWSDINGEHATDIVLHRVTPTATQKKP